MAEEKKRKRTCAENSSDENVDIEMFECRWSQCRKVYTNKNNRHRHEMNCKKGEFPSSVTTFKCENEWCLKVFERRYNYDRHLLTCVEPKQPIDHACIICDKTFDRPSKLLRHEKTHEKKTFSCGNCNALYQRLDKLKIHQKNCGDNPNVITNSPVLLKRASMMDLSTASTEESLVGTSNHPTGSFSAFHPPAADSEVPSIFSSSDVSPTSIDIPSAANHDAASVFSSIDVDPTYIDFERSTIPTSNPVSSSPEIAVQDDEFPDVYILNDSFSILDENCFMKEPAVYSKLEYQSDVTSCALKLLKTLRHQGKRSSLKMAEFVRMCLLLFNKKFDDSDFMNMLADDLGFQNSQEMIKSINTLSERRLSQRGRPLSNIMSRQAAYDFWRDNSSISNDRRNARHVVKVNPSKLDTAVMDLRDDRVTEGKSKGGIKYKAQKHIYSNTVRELYRQFQIKHSDLKVSLALFYRCKPFYVSPATEREMECCLCAKCLNPHALYSTLRRNMKDLPESLSEYLTTMFECSLDPHINFPKIECLNGTCKNNCSIFDESDKDIDCWMKRVSYYQFESKEEWYYDKAGEKKLYNRIARKDYKDQTLKSVYMLLQDNARSYLLHRYHTLSDKVYWQRYLDSTDASVVWMDYSQNIKLVEKNQVQSAHFSGKQQTLHDCLIIYKGQNKYVYHLSDDTTHDSVMTAEILKTIIDKHPEIIETGILVLRSDNCSTQYKSKFVFKALLDLAEEHSIRIYFFYGEPGHGRGLIDAMAWFGCKGPMRKEIVTKDIWFSNASEMYFFLSDHFRDDTSKEYYVIDQETTATQRKKGREEQVINGCKAAHCISFHPDGSYIKWATVKDFLERDQMEGQISNLEEEDEPEVEEPEVTWDGSIEINDKFSIIDEQSFVAIRAESRHPEMFHLMKVEEKRIAEHNITDSSGLHCVLKGEPYLLGKWFSFQHETKKFACYKESKTEQAMIHIGEVLATNLELNEKFQMDIFEYRMLNARVYY